MIYDTNLSFVAPGSPLSLIAAAGVDVPSTNVIDILGSGAGTAPHNIIGKATLFGSDTGIGTYRPYIQVAIGTAVTTDTSATLNVALQGAPDTGVGSGYVPGTYTTYAETGEIAVSDLTSGAVIRMDWAAAFPKNARPRYIRLLFQVPAGTTFTAGTIANAIVTMGRDDYSEAYAPRNYTV